MRTFSVDINEPLVLTEVYRWTANAAVQRGDANNVATSDNEALLKRFLTEGKKRLIAALGRYYIGDMEYSMPENWRDRSGDINVLAESFLVNYITAKWYEMNGTGERFIIAANEALEVIINLLNLREKPI